MSQPSSPTRRGSTSHRTSLAVSSSAASLPGSHLGLSGAVEQWHQAVVAIGIVKDGTPVLRGSGFFVDAVDKLICTCAHVVESCAELPAPELAVGIGSPIRWRYRAQIAFLSPPPAPRDARNGVDLAILVLAPDGLQPPFGDAAADATPPADETHGAADHRSDEAPLVALPLGHADALSQGDELVLLGYGQPSTGHTSTVTPTRGIFSGRYIDESGRRTGEWLKTDALLLSGHSGGPALNRIGEVIGWSVRSQADRMYSKLERDGVRATGGPHSVDSRSRRP
mmetsp:Transcript_49793/g.138024  ORF Transcript_49793/g.138024 Transcript_49793/m.138024 type:complete len:282 (-) Transcript_49793:117-962(-)